MSRLSRIAFALFVLLSSQAFATVFLVPEDKDLIEKSAAIVSGVVVDYQSQLRDDGYVETIYRVRIDRPLKGELEAGSVVEIVSEGGITEKRMTAVPGSAHFAKDDHIVLFLIVHKGRWTPTDMTLGKFRYVTSTGGQSLLLRDAEDIVGFDKEWRTHVERIRREKPFLSYIEQIVRGRNAEVDYFIAPDEAVSLPESEKGRFGVKTNNGFTPRSYSMRFQPGDVPGRWPEARMSVANMRPYYKNAAQDASGLGDGGEEMITNALNAWNGDCGSYVNAPYSGEHAALKNPNDLINVVVWNDPGNDIPDGSGIIAKAFNSGDDFHTFNNETDWVAMSDADVVVQNGFTGAEGVMATAMTHEIGHTFSIRHSDRHFDESACQVTDDCSSTAIMKAVITTHHNFALQTWDQSAIRALYPLACAPPPAAPTGLTATAVSTTQVDLTWNAVVGATTYKVFRRTAPGEYTQIFEALGTSHNDTDGLSANTGYQYVVKAINATGDSPESNADFTVTTVFTDAMDSGVTVKVVHFSELLTAVNALRTLAGLASISFTPPAPLTFGTVRAVHIDDLRTGLNAARTALGASAITFGESITPGVTPIRTAHITELRNGVF